MFSILQFRLRALFEFVTVSAVAVGALCAGTQSAAADPFTQTNLVSDIPGLAKITDPQLVNPWGVSFIGPAPPAPFSSPFWISNIGTNSTTLYGVTDTTGVTKVDINPPSGFVHIPTTASGPQGPTGQVSNTNPVSFDVGHGGNDVPALFIFANLNGTISAWNGGTSAFVQQLTPSAVYTGLAKNQAQTELYAANNSAGAIDVFDASFNPDSAVTFTTPSAISALHLTPFNVQDIGGSVYVTYAPIGRANQIAAIAGRGCRRRLQRERRDRSEDDRRRPARFALGHGDSANGLWGARRRSPGRKLQLRRRRQQ